MHANARCCSLSLLALIVPTVAVSDDRSDLINEIRGEWEARETRIKSAKFVWKEEREYRRGSIFRPLVAKLHGLKGRASEIGIPLQDVHFTVPASEFWITRDWIRYKTAQVFVARDGTVSLQDYLSSYDGEQSVMLSEHPARLPQGGIRSERRNTDTFVPYLKPLILWHSPLQAELSGLNVGSLTARQSTESVNGIACVRVEDGKNILWIDTARDYTISRWSPRLPNGSSNYRFDVEYAFDDQFGWIPRSWRGVQFSDDGVSAASEVTASVTEYDLSVDLRKEDFSVAFPPKTILYDQTTGQEYQLDEEGKRAALADPGRKQFVVALLVGNLLVVAVFLGRYLLRRIGQRRRSLASGR